MHCVICHHGIQKAAPERRVVSLDGFEVVVLIRKITPGQGSICDKCASDLTAKAVLIGEEKPQPVPTKAPISHI